VDPRTNNLPDAATAGPRVQSSDGTQKNQTCKDEGPLTLDRSRTVDEEISTKVIDFLVRNDPKKTNKTILCLVQPSGMHITTMLSPKYEAMIGEPGARTGPQRSRHEADGR